MNLKRQNLCFAVLVLAIGALLFIQYASIIDLTRQRRIAEKRRSIPNEIVLTTNYTYDPLRFSNHINLTRCKAGRATVFVYDVDGLPSALSNLSKRIFHAIESSKYAAKDSRSACLLMPRIDALSRDNLSPFFVANLEALFRHPLWQNGTNNLIINLFSGSFPDYSYRLDFPYGKAILLKASMHNDLYRPGIDISWPLLNENKLEFDPLKYKRKKRFLLSFKGKRYVHGLVGLEPRNSLHHLHNSRDVIILVTCRHGDSWQRFSDDRCAADNTMYNTYEYGTLLSTSSFCLVPRGRRLASFRFLESLETLCIPVVLSDNWVLPFSELINWPDAVLSISERSFFLLPHHLRRVPKSEISRMRANVNHVFRTHFSSIDAIVDSTFLIIQRRLDAVLNDRKV